MKDAVTDTVAIIIYVSTAFALAWLIGLILL